MSLTVQQQRLSIDTINFQDVSVGTRSTSVVQSAMYDTIISGVTDLSGASVLGLGTYSMNVTAGNVGAGVGQCVASADTVGNVQLRRIKAGTDTVVTSDSTSIQVNLAPTITRTNSTINGALTTGSSTITTVSNCSSAAFTGEVTLNSTFSPALSSSAIWTPNNKGDLMTFDANGNVITHISTGQTDGNVLAVDKNSTTGISWISPPASGLNIETSLPLTDANRIVYIDQNNEYAGTIIPTAHGDIFTAGNAREPLNLLKYDFNAAAGSKVTWADPSSEAGTTFNRTEASLTFSSPPLITGNSASADPLIAISTTGGISGTNNSRIVLHNAYNFTEGTTINNSALSFDGNVTALTSSTDPVRIYFGNTATPTATDCHVSLTPNGTYGNLLLWSSTGTISVSGNPTDVTLTFRRAHRLQYTAEHNNSTICDSWLVEIPAFRGLAGNAFNTEKIITPTAASLSYFSESIPTSTMIYGPAVYSFDGAGDDTAAAANVAAWRAGSVGIGRNSSGDFVIMFRYDGAQYAFGDGYIHFLPTTIMVHGSL